MSPRLKNVGRRALYVLGWVSMFPLMAVTIVALPITICLYIFFDFNPFFWVDRHQQWMEDLNSIRHSEDA